MRYFLLLLGFLTYGATLHAALGQGDISCRSGDEGNQPYKKKLWSGYEISLGPARNAEETGNPCTAAIYNAAGKVVFRTNAFGVILDEDWTGEDFDGDGQPEVVFQVDTGGGAHCCWGYDVVSLFPKSHRLFTVGAGGAVWFHRDKSGRMEVWHRTPGPYQYTDTAERPYADQVFRIQEGKLVDSTPAFCSKILASGNADYDRQKQVLTPETIKNLASGIDKPADEVASALLSRALQHALCRQFDDAMNDINLWPAATRDDVKSDFAESIKNDCPEFAARLGKSQ